MESFVVSARKYRPRRFKEVIGQQGVTTTLKNAIRSGHIAQSFLFCGPRGVGKTTCARILAKTINCTNVGADYEACGQCHSCKSFEQNISFNIHELDAASNNSVEDIRELVAQVRIPPQDGKYKVYIIDEVHMLSQAAFNAFLKTLEEPPAYAVFILATTEKHKIIPTILSRCQIYEFSRITTREIAEHLQSICDAEKITADTNALHIIAQKADGALRDALSMFDRLVDPINHTLTLDSVISNLNILDYDYYFRFTDYMLTADISRVMLLFDEIMRKGFEGDLLLVGLSEHFRNLLVCKDTQTTDLLEASGDLRQRYLQQAAQTPATFLLNALNIASQYEIYYKTARNKRLLVELALLKMTLVHNVVRMAANTPPAAEVKKKPESSISPAEITTTSALQAASFVASEKKSVASTSLLNTQTPHTQTTTTVSEPATNVVLLHQPQQKTRKKLSLDHSISINSIEQNLLSSNKQIETEAIASDTKKQKISQEEMNQLWENYASSIVSDKPHITSLFRFNRPIATEEGFKVTVNTQVQKNMFDEVLPHFADYVKKQKAISVGLVVELSKENEKTPAKAFTQKEKLDRMIQKNHHLLALIQQLQLKL